MYTQDSHEYGDPKTQFAAVSAIKLTTMGLNLPLNEWHPDYQKMKPIGSRPRRISLYVCDNRKQYIPNTVLKFYPYLVLKPSSARYV